MSFLHGRFIPRQYFEAEWRHPSPFFGTLTLFSESALRHPPRDVGRENWLLDVSTVQLDDGEGIRARGDSTLFSFCASWTTEMRKCGSKMNTG